MVRGIQFFRGCRLGAVASVAMALGSLGIDSANAATPATHLSGDEDGAIVAERGEALRGQVRLEWNKPSQAASQPWSKFKTENPGAWQSLWDRDVGVPLRVFGRGIEAPGTTHSASSAESFALEFAARHDELFLPGSSLADFVVVSNVLDRSGVRSVGLLQYRCGHRVVGGQISFRFKNNRLFVIASEAFPNVPCLRSSKPIGLEATNNAARTLLAGRYGTGVSSVGTPSDLQILPLVRSSGALEFTLARQARVDSTDPIGSWDVWLDAGSGAPIARRQRLAFADGTLHYKVPQRYWAGTRKEYVAHQTSVTVNGQAKTTDAAGGFDWDAGAAMLTAIARGPRVRVTSEAGAAASFSATVNDGGTAVWDSDQGEFLDAQLTTFIHSLIVKEWLKVVAPQHPFYTAQLPAIVNKSGSCNAFSDGTSINFLRAGNGCGNTGRIADVVYHEFGHSMHNHSVIAGVGSWDAALSEGLGDFLSATITGDPAVGPGFFGDGSVLRHCDPEGSEHVWPADVGAIHHTGKIYCGAMFDLRKNLISSLGETEGIATVNQLFYDSFRRASNIPTTYIEVLAADDDDGNLENGTPNECAINEAYGRHGMADPDRESTPSLGLPTLEGRTVSLRSPSSEFCPGGGVASAVLEWRVEGEESSGGVIDFAEVDQTLVAELPETTWGRVVRYQVRAVMDGGDERVFPQNLADDFYQRFVGDGEVIHCDSFDGSDEPVGWEHGLLAGEPGDGADDWQWGPVFGAAGSGDPASAFSGDGVWGNDLGAGNFNGIYQGEKTNFLRSPAIDATGYDVVRLQYRRWLNVEDGAFDVASIEVDDGVLWSNKNTGGATNHTDREWRFHDVELTDVASGSMQITYKLATDQGTEMGGWTIDDFCVIGYNLPVCGDGAVTGDEQCDDGNTDAEDGCSATCEDETPDDPRDPSDPADEDAGGCGCQSGSSGGTGAALLALIALVAMHRRRKR